MRDIENEIRNSLERLTDPHGNNPSTDALWDDLVDRRRNRRNRSRAFAALPLLLVAVLAVGIFSAQGSDNGRSDVATGGEEPPGVASCVTEFSAQTLRDRAFAFDGSVTKVGTAKDPRAPEEDDVFNATFEVHEWFAGGSGESVTVWMQRPVELGERLLVAGEPRWGGAPLDDAIAWECGFTVAHSSEGASEWADAFATTDEGEDCALADDSRPSARCGGVYGPVMFGPEQHGVMEQARLAGRVLLEGDCLYLMQESDAARYAPLPIVWPYGTLWEDDPAGVRLADGTFVPVGAEITARGGGHDIDRLTELGHADSVAGRARQCAGDGVQTVAYVQGEIEVLPEEQAPLDSSQGKGFVLKFLGHLRDGDFEAAATLWSGYPVSEPNRPISERVQYVDQLAEYPPFARIVASDTMTMFVTPSTANHGGHVITILDPRSADTSPVAVAFLTGLSGEGDAERWWIQRLPATDPTANTELSDDGYVEPGEQVVVPGLPVEGGVRGFVNSAEVPVEADLENETFTVVVPESASGDIALTFVVSTPEEPIVRSFAATVR